MRLIIFFAFILLKISSLMASDTIGVFVMTKFKKGKYWLWVNDYRLDTFAIKYNYQESSRQYLIPVDSIIEPEDTSYIEYKRDKTLYVEFRLYDGNIRHHQTLYLNYNVHLKGYHIHIYKNSLLIQGVSNLNEWKDRQFRHYDCRVTHRTVFNNWLHLQFRVNKKIDSMWVIE